MRAAEEAVAYERQTMIERNARFREELIERGMEMYALEDEAVWIERARTVWPNYYEDVGGRDLIDRIDEIKASR